MLNSNNLNNKFFIGIDVSKETLDIFFSNRFYKINNTQEAISTFIKAEIASWQVSLCVLEPTGGYEKLVLDLLHKHNIPVHRAHPNRVHAFAAVCNHSAKTDKLDALLLSKYAEFVFHEEKGDAPTDPENEKIKELRRLISCIEDDIHAAKCRLKQFGKPCHKFLTQQIELLETQKKSIYEEIISIINACAELKDKFDRIQTIPGIGKKSAATILAEVPEIGTLTKREVASLLGVAPRTKQSGQRTMNAHIMGGRFIPRKALYMSALVASKHCKNLSVMYEQMISDGKQKKVALVALMRKIIIYANALIKNQTKYEVTTIKAI